MSYFFRCFSVLIYELSELMYYCFTSYFFMLACLSKSFM